MSKDPFIDEKIKAMLEGSKAFKDELPRKSPYEHKSGLEYAHVAWLTGWDDGERLRDCARLDWLTANLETFFTSKFHILAKFDGVRAGIDAAMKATK
jgi:hypothetical protein